MLKFNIKDCYMLISWQKLVKKHSYLEHGFLRVFSQNRWLYDINQCHELKS